VGCPLQPDLVNTSCSESCALDAVLACGRAVHLTHELTYPPFCLYPTCPTTSISIRLSLEMRGNYDASPRYEMLYRMCQRLLGLPSSLRVPRELVSVSVEL